MAITLHDAQRILDHHFPNAKYSEIVAVTEIKNTGFSYTNGTKTYLFDIAPSVNASPTHSCFISLSTGSTPSASAIWHPNDLHIASTIIALISAKTSIPIAKSALDTSHSIIPYDFLLTLPYPLRFATTISLADALEQGRLTPKQRTLVDMQLGMYMGQLHSGVQNDWFGLPQSPDPSDPSYSWQETFTMLFDSLLTSISTLPWFPASSIPVVGDIQRHMGRAIAYFLFDDVEVPSLVWLTGSAHDIYITLGPDESLGVAAILPNTAHALWGDPLMESLLMSPGPSDAMMEGYRGGGGDPAILAFPRQRTKRVWYEMFLALVVLSEYSDGTEHSGGNITDEKVEREKKRKWGLETLRRCTEELGSAPFY